MFSKAITALALVAPLVTAQTFTSCNPLTTSKFHIVLNTFVYDDLHPLACPPDPAFGKETVHCDFTKGACSAFEEDAGTSIQHTANGAVFTIGGPNQAPTVATGKYILFGRVDIEVQASSGVGIVTSAVLQSDCLDEVCLYHSILLNLY
jgi:hypothetical protein